MTLTRAIAPSGELPESREVWTFTLDGDRILFLGMAVETRPTRRHAWRPAEVTASGVPVTRRIAPPPEVVADARRLLCAMIMTAPVETR